jgi:hypothetical protein
VILNVVFALDGAASPTRCARRRGLPGRRSLSRP